MAQLLAKTSNGKATAKKPRSNGAASRSVTPQVIVDLSDDGDSKDDTKLAPMFRKPAAAAAKKAAPKAAASKSEDAPKAFSLSDSEEELLPAPKTKKSAAAKPAATKKTANGLGRKKAAAKESDDDEDSFAIDSPAAGPSRTSGRSARAASKTSYKIADSEDEDS